jgi:hypothetical protein
MNVVKGMDQAMKAMDLEKVGVLLREVVWGMANPA